MEKVGVISMRWRSTMAYVYAIICIFDFVIFPTFIGVFRVEVDDIVISIKELPPEIQFKILDSRYGTHVPLTLQGGGLFHLAFGALLTGAAIRKTPENKIVD